MKKIIITLLVIALLASALTGCGSRRNDETVAPTPGIDNTDSAIVPEDDNGVVNDGNGIIGDSNASGTDVPGEGMIPQIGNDIENGVDDVIDGVGNAIEGNDNNSGNAADEARSRARMR